MTLPAAHRAILEIVIRLLLHSLAPAQLGSALLAGCDVHYPVNALSARQDATQGYRLERVKADPDNPGDVLVIVTFSGGGTRAASLASERSRRCAT